MTACPVSSCNSRLIRRRSASSPFNRCRETSAASEAVVSTICRLGAALWDTHHLRTTKPETYHVGTAALDLVTWLQPTSAVPSSEARLAPHYPVLADCSRFTVLPFDAEYAYPSLG